MKDFKGMNSIEILEDNNEFLKDYSKGDDMFYYRYSVGFDAIAELKERLDKYCWHDLRKDAEDLPKKEGYCMLCVVIKGNDIWGIPDERSYKEAYWYDGSFLSLFPQYSVIAWRYIEEFESESNEE